MRSNIIDLDSERGKILSSNKIWTKMLTVALGSVFLALMAQASVKIPFNPVPISLQTLGVMLLALTLTKNEAFFAVVAYLTQATLGLPVIAGGVSNPLWIVSPTGGYLLGFAFAAYVIAWMLGLRSERTFLWSLFSLISGMAVIYLFGCSFLAYFIGIENAITLGFLPFIISGVLKLIASLSFDKPIQFCKNFLMKSR